MMCPCCSNLSYDECCKQFHQGSSHAATPLDLMRSRYCAYALGLTDYIQATTHPKSPYYEADKTKWTESIELFSKTTQFIRLEIDSYGNDWVSFIAHLKQKNVPVELIEKSRFEQINDRWLYVDGHIYNRTK
jgi:SEC-C motif-containing protein